MYSENKRNNRINLFGFQNTLSDKLKKQLIESVEYCFFQTVFSNIKEDIFSILYSDKASRPNAPVNCLIGATILKEMNNWTFKELFDNMYFNLLTKTALGLDTLDDIPFNYATFFNFQKRLADYQAETGENLLEQVFDNLTKKQIKDLKLKTNIQRSDALMASSNIKNYSRLQLLIEIIIRLYRVLEASDQDLFKNRFNDYVNKSSGQYLYHLKSSDIPHELNKLSELYYFCKETILPKYQDKEIAKVFDRVYLEHFTKVESRLEIKTPEELHSSCLQSPDDLDATYREKNDQSYKGQSINIVETIHPDNPINLLTDISVNPNNIDDSQIINERIDNIIAKTPELEELHTDGAYGSPANDIKFEEYKINHIQTAVRGREGNTLIEIEQISEDKYEIKCSCQSVISEKTRKHHKATFDKKVCGDCPHLNSCPAIERKKGRTYYFTHKEYLKNKRHRAILKIYS